MKKLFGVFTLISMVLATIAVCSTESLGASGDFDVKGEITVVSREDGSGTRGAFIELFGIEVKKGDGSRKDMTTKEAVIANKTDVMLASVASNPYAIGYISLGSLSGSVKALAINGVAATTANVKNGTYQTSRPFLIATGKERVVNVVAADFIRFILSKEGQDIVGNDYIAIDDNAPAYSGDKPKGKISVAGSSSVSPIMEKLKEAYVARNPNAEIEIQMSDSTAGMAAVINGICNIGMASREMKGDEKANLDDIIIARDGIAVIVNPANPTLGVGSEQVKKIFTGETRRWNEVNE